MAVSRSLFGLRRTLLPVYKDIPWRCAYSSGTITRDKIEVLYDGHCPLCVKEIDVLKWFNKNRQTISFIDITTAQFKPENHMNISYDQAMAEMHVIDTNGTVYTGMPSFHVMYGALGLGWFWSWTKLPGMEKRADKMYMWFAKNRLWLTGRNCDTGRCDVKLKPKDSDAKK